ncbi:hypothetical protein TSUD_389980 [Trifolium subterraneum]|uniref:Reverse transcriptase domain-containing protein n=1 Tax=Trifolium subterraneum TaxID=3900 RepID=A0A2Z6PEH0_TRISU|nr:hypothetical protein TSUD_389980 [Trifolium subterraneum]
MEQVKARGKRKKPHKEGSLKSKSSGKQGTSLSAGSDTGAKSLKVQNWKSWVVLHGNSKQVHDDVVELGENIGVKCSNSFQALTCGRGSGSGNGRVKGECFGEGGIITIWDPCVLNVWSSIVKMHCLIVTGQFIEDNVDFFLANVYAPCESTGRVNLWNGLDGFLQQHRQMAGCVLGDFNTVRSQEERRSRQNWGPRPLRMLKCWSDIPGYSDFVKDKWSSFHIRGWSGYILKEKLKLIKKELRFWHLNHTSNIDSKIQDAKKRLEDLDITTEDRRLTEVEEAEFKTLPVDILTFSKLQASMNWQKSRINWLREGDANSKFFHGIMSFRKRGNSIASFTVDGRSIEGVAEVRQHVFDHFQNHYRKVQFSRPDISGLSFSTVSELDREELIKPFLLEEIKTAIWDCDSFKSPGPAGVNLGFFKDFWEVLKIDLLNFFSEFHRQGILSKGLNSTFIALIPKVESPQRVADFRPIVLVSSIYKIISKVLANRLRNVIGNIVSKSQSAFIKGRQILDGVLIANEVVDDAKCNNKDLLLFKVDFEKAYDSVDWDYLSDVMIKMNFPSVWRGWIMECVTSASASVLVNGCPTEEFHFERGPRQGDPLSPFLFLLAAGGLHVLMEAMVSNSVFTPYGIGLQNSVSISHLQFADDTLLIGEKSWANVRALKAVLLLFENISGLRVNFHKSLLCGININRSWLLEAASVMCCKYGQLPFLYLGLPIGGDPRKLNFWYPLVVRIRNRLSGWKCKNLSIGGRLILLKSVLSSIPVYYLSFFSAPSGIISSLDSIFCHFFWGGCEDNRKIAWVNWETVCLRKEVGGLGVRRLKEFNVSLLGKWVWRLMVEHDSLWSMVLKAKCGEEGGCVRFEEGVGSVWWRSLNRVRSGAGLLDSRWLKDNLIRNIGNDRETLFWKDPWLGDCSLARSFGRLFDLAENKLITVHDMYEAGWGVGGEALMHVMRGCGSYILHKVTQLPTKLNLHRRGVLDEQHLSCATSCGKFEDLDHLFFQCDVYGRLWSRISNWLGVTTAFPGSATLHSTHFCGIGGFSRGINDMLIIIWIAVLFVIWKDQNSRIFKSGYDSLEAMAEKVKRYSFWWLKSYYVLFDFDYSFWRLYPLSCCQAIM